MGRQPLTVTIRTSRHGSVTLAKADLKHLAAACAEPDRHGINVVLWEPADQANDTYGGRMVATNGHYLLRLDVAAAPEVDDDMVHPAKAVCFYGAELKSLLKPAGSLVIEPEQVDAIDFPDYHVLVRGTRNHGFALTTLTNPTKYAGSTEPGFAILEPGDPKGQLAYHTNDLHPCERCEFGVVVPAGLETPYACRACDGTAQSTRRDGAQEVDYNGECIKHPRGQDGRVAMGTVYLTKLLRFFGGAMIVDVVGPLAVVVFVPTGNDDGVDANRYALLMPIRLD